jgi:ankyrin repeat protein
LHVGCKYGSWDAVKVLVFTPRTAECIKVDVNVQNISGYTPLHVALDNTFQDVGITLVKAKASLTIVDSVCCDLGSSIYSIL